MPASIETLRFAKESVVKARLNGESLIEEMVPRLLRLQTPVEHRVLELRGFVRGLIAGQDVVLQNIRSLVPEEQLPVLTARARKVTAPDSHWGNKFEQSLVPLVADSAKSQERATIFLGELAKRVHDLVVWEGILDQLIGRQQSKHGTARPKKTTSADETGNLSDAAVEAKKLFVNDLPMPGDDAIDIDDDPLGDFILEDLGDDSDGEDASITLKASLPVTSPSKPAGPGKK